MKYLNKFRAVFRRMWLLVPEPTSRSYVLFTTVISFMIATAVAISVNTYEGARNRLESQKIDFLTEANALDDKVMAYLYLIDNDKSIVGEPTESIVRNLIHQYHLVDYVAAQLDKNDQQIVANYKKQLVKFRQDLPESTSVLSMQKFVNDFQSIAVTQEVIKEKLAN